MAKVIKNEEGEYTFEGETYTIDETGKSTLCLISRFDDYVLITDKKLNVLYQIVSISGQNEASLRIENYNL